MFTVSLDFGAGVFAGSARWLEVGVRPGGTSGAFTTLTPRQPLTPAPQSLYATTAATATLGHHHGHRDDRTAATSANQLAGQLPAFYLKSRQPHGHAECRPGRDRGDVTGRVAGASNRYVPARDERSGCQRRWHGDLRDRGAEGRRLLATLDSGGTVGQHTSITIGADGLGLISYYDATNKDLKVAHCANVACSSLTPTTPVTLDSGTSVDGDVGQYTSITIGTDGLGLISYYDATNGELKVAHCTNPRAAPPRTRHAAGQYAATLGGTPSITIGTDGLGLISYYDNTNGNLKVAHCANRACSSVTVTTLDSAGTVGQFTVDHDWGGWPGPDQLLRRHERRPEGRPLPEYRVHHRDPRHARQRRLVWAVPSITIGADGLGLISYHDVTNRDLKVAHCANRALHLRRRHDARQRGAVGRTRRSRSGPTAWASSATTTHERD